MSKLNRILLLLVVWVFAAAGGIAIGYQRGKRDADRWWKQDVNDIRAFIEHGCSKSSANQSYEQLVWATVPVYGKSYVGFLYEDTITSTCYWVADGQRNVMWRRRSDGCRTEDMPK